MTSKDLHFCHAFGKQYDEHFGTEIYVIAMEGFQYHFYLSNH